MPINLNNLTFEGGALTLRQTDLTKRSTSVSKMTEAYDEHAKLVYLFDASGSMIAKLSRKDDLVVTNEQLVGVKQAIQDAIERQKQAVAEKKEINLKDRRILYCAKENWGTCSMSYEFFDDNEHIRDRINRYDLYEEFGLASRLKTRFEVVHDLAESELKARYAKYPKSRVAMIPFATRPVVMFDDGTPEDMFAALASLSINEPGDPNNFRELNWGGEKVTRASWSGKDVEVIEGGESCGGDTDILEALRKAMDVCRAKPSRVGIHHFVVVSDGQDYKASDNIASWVPAFKASGVVLDYIHIGSDSPNSEIERACKATGGDCVAVSTEDDLKARFIEASRRLCLPPAQ